MYFFTLQKYSLDTSKIKGFHLVLYFKLKLKYKYLQILNNIVTIFRIQVLSTDPQVYML